MGKGEGGGKGKGNNMGNNKGKDNNMGNNKGKDKGKGKGKDEVKDKVKSKCKGMGWYQWLRFDGKVVQKEQSDTNEAIQHINTVRTITRKTTYQKLSLLFL